MKDGNMLPYAVVASDWVFMMVEMVSVIIEGSLYIVIVYMYI